jgi:hypothetical protein
MSNSKATGIGPIVKSLVVTFFKLLAIVISFTCKVASLLIAKIGEIFEKLSGHGNH